MLLSTFLSSPGLIAVPGICWSCIVGITALILLLRVLCRSVIEQIELVRARASSLWKTDWLERAGDVPGCWLSKFSFCRDIFRSY